MHILISGGTGFIGGYLIRELIRRGDQVTVITRDAPGRTSRHGEKYISWDEVGEAVGDCDAVINLAGSNLFARRWNESVKRDILESRILSTSRLVNAIRDSAKKPSVFISGSAVGYYGSSGDEVFTENSSPGDDFLARVCMAWEQEAQKLKGVRLVLMRTGIVLQKDDGALSKMLIPFYLYGGGPLGNGRQYYPWIHMEDMVGLLLYSIENETVNGPVNATAPEPVRMKIFAETLGKVISRPSWFPVPEFMLSLALGEVSESITASLRAVPEKALESGYTFRHSDLEAALKDILDRD